LYKKSLCKSGVTNKIFIREDKRMGDDKKKDEYKSPSLLKKIQQMKSSIVVLKKQHVYLITVLKLSFKSYLTLRTTRCN
jgi:hypothetical protein